MLIETLSNESITNTYMNWNHNNLIKKVAHNKFKEFAKEQMADKGLYRNAYVAFLIGFGFLFAVAVGYGVSLMFLAQEFTVIIQVTTGVLFCFTILIILHELLHGLAYKLSGAKNVYFGAIFSKFLFYAGSDQEEFNGTRYRFVALFPFVIITGVSLLMLLLYSEYIPFGLAVLFVHTLFCGGDFAAANFIAKHDLKKIHTYDSREKGETYFYFKDETVS